MLNYYAGRNEVSDLDFEEKFCNHVGWNPTWARPYVVDADKTLVEQIGGDDMVRGCTISAVGFYGPQGRELRLPLSNPDLNSRIETFRYDGQPVTNYEMESAPLQGLSLLMGHRAMTVCSIIANRMCHEAAPKLQNCHARSHPHCPRPHLTPSSAEPAPFYFQWPIMNSLRQDIPGHCNSRTFRKAWREIVLQSHKYRAHKSAPYIYHP